MVFEIFSEQTNERTDGGEYNSLPDNTLFRETKKHSKERYKHLRVKYMAYKLQAWPVSVHKHNLKRRYAKCLAFSATFKVEVYTEF